MGAHDTLFYNGAGHYPTWIKGRWGDETMLELGHVNTHGRWVNVFFNGQYWGQYHLREHFDDHFMRRTLVATTPNTWVWSQGPATLTQAATGSRCVLSMPPMWCARPGWAKPTSCGPFSMSAAKRSSRSVIPRWLMPTRSMAIGATSRLRGSAMRTNATVSARTCRHCGWVFAVTRRVAAEKTSSMPCLSRATR